MKLWIASQRNSNSLIVSAKHYVVAHCLVVARINKNKILGDETLMDQTEVKSAQFDVKMVYKKAKRSSDFKHFKEKE